MKKIVLIVLTLIISACSSTEQKSEDMVLKNQNKIVKFLSNKRFHLTEINGEDIPYHYKSNIIFKNNLSENINFITSKTPCNRLFGDYNIEDEYIIIENLKSTKMVCEKEKFKYDILMSTMYKMPLKVEIIDHGFILRNNKNYMKFKKYHK